MTIWRLVDNFLSQFFHNLLYFSSHEKERSTTHLFGITLNVCSSLLFTTSTSAWMMRLISFANFSPAYPPSVNIFFTSESGTPWAQKRQAIQSNLRVIEEELKTLKKFLYSDDHNKRFSIPAKSTVDAHRPLSDDLRNRLPSIFSIQSKRKVNNDYTIQFKNKWFQLEAAQDTPVYKRDEVIVEERPDRILHVRLKNVYLKYHDLPDRPKPMSVPVVALTKRKPDWKPPLNHPWRRNNF